MYRDRFEEGLGKRLIEISGDNVAKIRSSVGFLNNEFAILEGVLSEMTDYGYHTFRSRDLIVPVGEYVQLKARIFLGDIVNSNTTTHDSLCFKNDCFVFSSFGDDSGDPSFGDILYYIDGCPDFFTVGDWVDLIPDRRYNRIGEIPKDVRDAMYFSIIHKDHADYLPTRIALEIFWKLKGYLKEFLPRLILIDNNQRWIKVRKILGKNIQGHFYLEAMAKRVTI